MDADWQDHAACKGTPPELMFPERGDDVQAAKAVCRTCPVCDACLIFALENGEQFGIWGGTSERQRRRLRAAMDRARRHATIPRSDIRAGAA